MHEFGIEVREFVWKLDHFLYGIHVKSNQYPDDRSWDMCRVLIQNLDEIRSEPYKFNKAYTLITALFGEVEIFRMMFLSPKFQTEFVREFFTSKHTTPLTPKAA